MALSETEIDEFIHIYKEEIGKDISRSEAHELAHRFLSAFKVVCRAIPSDARDAENPK